MNRAVYLIRHGDTIDNAATPGPERERSWGNEPLHPMGVAEVRRTAKKLSRFGIKAIVSSDLKRAKQSAEIIGDWLGVTPTFDAKLRTWNTGELGGKLKSETEPEIAKLVRFSPDRVIAGGESFDQFCARVFEGLSEALAKNKRDPIAIIIHARIERLIEGWKAAGSKADHKIDVDVFLAKPEQPGHIELWHVNPSAL